MLHVVLCFSLDVLLLGLFKPVARVGNREGGGGEGFGK